MAGKKLKIAVAGLGRIGWATHCRVLTNHKDYQLVAVTDTDPDRRKEAEDVYGCNSYDSFTKMLKEEHLDVVTIATPTHLHKKMSIEAFKAGTNVFLEKPMALNLKEAKEIVASSKRYKKALTIFQPHRVTAYFQQLLDIIDKGLIGDVYHVKRGLFSFTRRNDWQSLKKYGGGMLANYGAHLIDQLMFLTGYDIKKIYCNTRKVASLGDTDDAVKIIYETKKGIIGEIDINQALTIRPYEMEVYGTNGTAVKEGNFWKVTSFKKKDLPAKKLETSLTAAGRKYPSENIKFKKQTIKVNSKMEIDIYADFANAIRKRKSPVIKPEQVVAVMKMIENCRKEAGKLWVTPIV